MTNDKKPRGGKREGAGAPLKFGEKTKIVHTRVPETKVPAFKENAQKFLEQFKVSKHFYCWDEEALGAGSRCKVECDICKNKGIQ